MSAEIISDNYKRKRTLWVNWMTDKPNKDKKSVYKTIKAQEIRKKLEK